MRLSPLIPALVALGLAGCQVPPPATDGVPVRTAAPAATPVITPTVAEDDEAAPIKEAEDVAVDAQDDSDTEDDITVSGTEQTSASATASLLTAEMTTDDEALEAAPADPISEPAQTATAPLPEASSEVSPEDSSETAEMDETVIAEATSETPAETSVTDEANTAPGGVEEEVALALAAPPPPPPPPPPPELDPQTLLGLDEDGLRRRLGDADFSRTEGGMETRQYRLGECVVDYFLFTQDGSPRIVAWAWRTPVIGDTVDALSCRRALAARELSG